MVGVLPAKALAAFAPASREDSAAALRVPSVEDDEVLAARADVNRVIEIGAAAGAV